jgi:hypothetical protein
LSPSPRERLDQRGEIAKQCRLAPEVAEKLSHRQPGADAKKAGIN